MAFVPMSVKPQFTGSHDAAVLLYNQCDGLHIAYARFLGNEEDETNGFSGFWEFAGSEHNPEHFAAWAYLPDCNEHLFPIFGDPRPFEERA
jgi:hypothetical protein